MSYISTKSFHLWRKRALMCVLMLCCCIGMAQAASIYVATTGNDGTGDGTMGNPYATIGKAISVASNGDVINVADGTYVQTATLVVNKELTLLGQSQAGTIIDVSGVAASGWGVNLQESNTTLKNFTIIPNPQVAPPGGGFPIHAYGAGVKNNLTVENITVNASRRTGVDIHGYNDVTVKNVKSTYATAGNGIQFTGCNNVDISNIITFGNAWGSIAVYVSTVFAGGSSSNINFDYTSSTIAELNIFYTQTNPSAPLLTITGITTPGLNFTIKNTAALARTHYQPIRFAAVNFAVTLNTLNTNKGSFVNEIATGQFWVGLNMSGAMSIQTAIDAASAGGMVNVLAGNYGKQIATNRQVFGGVGIYQFGLFIDKDNLTIRGYKPDSTLATNAADAAAEFTTGATNNFGSSGIFVQASGVTLQGLKIGDNFNDSNVLSNNKTVEVVGNNFTMKDCWVKTVANGGAIYFGEWDSAHPISSYNLTENIFENTLISINNGVGLTGLRSGRTIKDNEFKGQAVYGISFRGWNGAGPVQGWIVKPVGGAVVTGNTFNNDLSALTLGYILARGNAGGYVNSELDWKEMWDDNTYGNHTVTLTDLPSFDVRSYNASGYTESRRISAVIQPNINISVNGDVVLASDGNFTENLTVDKNIKLISENGRSNTTITGISGVGALGAILVTTGSNGVQIGDINKGFKVMGIENGMPGIENAAVYFQGNHTNAKVIGNELVANGEACLLTEFNLAVDGLVIDNNIFSGKTFVGPNPADNGFGNQFTTPNVPRQLVAIGCGGNCLTTQNITFTNNQITGITGGTNGGGEQGNGLVTIDAKNVTITGNTFAGTTTRFAASLRARGSNTVITGNNFSSANLGMLTAHLTISATTLTGTSFANIDDVVVDGAMTAVNTFDKGAYQTDGLNVYHVINVSLGSLGMVTGKTIRVLKGTYPENVIVNKEVSLWGANVNKTGTAANGCGVRKPESIINAATGNAMTIITNNVTVSGFQFTTGAGNGIGSGTNYGGDANNVSILGNVFDDIKGSGIDVGTPNVMQNWAIRFNKFDKITSSGINPWRITNLSVEDNCITNAQRGIQLDGNATNIFVRRNNISNISVQGIQVGNNCGGVMISENVIDKANTTSTADRGGITFYATTLQGSLNIQNNIVSNSFNGVASRDVSNDVTGKNITITLNNLENNSNKTVYHNHTSILPVTCNWHGVAAYAAAVATVSTNVDIVTRLTDGTDTNVPTIGFQPDLTKCKGKPNKKVSPILECVRLLGNGDYEATFGYKNDNDEDVIIPIGNDNKFTPTPIGRGQPTTFLPGRQVAVFTVIFDGNPLVWSLKNPLEGQNRTATASNNAASICKSITVSPIADVCAGGNTTVTFTTTGAYGMGNTFNVELSAPNGSFASPTVLASGTSPLGVTLPNNIASYKVRVVSSSPAVTSNEVSLVTKFCVPVCNPPSNANPNLVVNGDFEAGATGFTSEYSFGNMYDPQIIAVTDNPNSLHTAFSACEDHTPSPGTKMLLVNGAEIPNVKVWCQNVSVVAGQTYTFTAWATSVHPAEPGVLELTANIMGVNTGISLTPDVCKWTQFGGNWTATTTGSVEICIITKGTAFGGNDFAIDDISFGFACTPTLTATCPANVTVNTDKDICTASGVSLGTPTFSGTCPPISTSNDAPVVFPIGNTTVTWTISDACGNITKCTQLVTVVDTQKPTIMCAADVVTYSEPDKCFATIQLNAPKTGDNCGIQSVTNNAPATFPVGITTVIWTVTDVNGNQQQCAQNVTVNDITAPSIICPANITVNNDAGKCSKVVTFATPSFGDNCSNATITQTVGLVSGSEFPVGVNIVTFEATDAAGNKTKCSFTVTVKDTEKPTIICPANITVNNDKVLGLPVCLAKVNYSLPTFNDNCAGTTIKRTSGPLTASGSLFPVGTTTVTYEATDAAGNTSTCSFTITVKDVAPPAIACPANIVKNNDVGVCGAVVTFKKPIALDQCLFGVTVTQTAGLPSGSVFPVGTTTVTFEATDAAGNTATCSFTVKVNDTEKPKITCPPSLSINADAGKNFASGVALGTPITSDNCAVNPATNNAPLTFPLGTTTVTWTVTDLSGNSATCTQKVTVTDGEAPTVTCPANVSVFADQGKCSTAGANVTLGNPIASDNDGIASVTNNAPSSFPVGVTIVIWTVTDKAGNKATCEQTVTVTDNQLPTITCPANITVNAEQGKCSATVKLGDAQASDNCGVKSITNDAPSTFPVGTTTVTWTVTDVNGNKNTCEQKVTVTDNQAPVLVGLPANLNITVSCNQVPSAPTVTATDNCGAQVTYEEKRTDGNCINNYVLKRTWTAKDGAGNMTTATQTITVEDKTPPVVTCPADISRSINANETGANVSFSATATDACAGAVSLSYAPASGSFFAVGTTTVTVTATDACGNKSTCTFKVIVTKRPPACVADCNRPKYASSVASYSPGNRKNGLALPPSRAISANALGVPQNNDTNNFVSLGFGGNIVLRLGSPVLDHNASGGDIFIVETSFGRAGETCVIMNSSTYPETAKVEGSEDGINFVFLGNLCRAGAVDVAPAIRAGMNCVKFIRITDTSNPMQFSGNDDGFDVDGVLVCPRQVMNAINALACAQNQPSCVRNNRGRTEGTDEDTYEFDAEFSNLAPNAVEQVSMSMFPNPANSEVNLDIIADESVGQVTLIMYNALGVLVESKQFNTEYGFNRNTMQVSHLATGIYFIKATSKDGSFTQTFKLVKE